MYSYIAIIIIITIIILFSCGVEISPRKDLATILVMPLYWPGYSSEIESTGYIQTRFVLRNWLTWLWRLTGPKSAGWAGCLKTQWRVNAAVQVEGLLLQNSLLLRRGLFFVLFRPRDWMRPIHITKDKPLYSKFTNLNINFI